MKEEKITRIEIPCASGQKLVAEINADPCFKEIFVFLEKEDGTYQQLAIVGECYQITPNLDVKPVAGEYAVKVYSDKDSDDWQEEFRIGEYKEENNGTDRQV